MPNVIKPMLLPTLLLGVLVGSASAEWRTINAETNPELPSDEIQFIEPASEGGMWIGTLEGLTRYHNGKLTKKVFKVKDRRGREKELKLRVYDVLEEPDGTMWIGHAGGILQVKGDERRSHLGGFTISPIIRLNEETLLAMGRTGAQVAASRKLFVYREGQWQEVEALNDQRVEDMFQDRQGRVWITLEGNGVKVFGPQDGLESFTHHLKGLAVTSVAQDNQGHIWCGLWGGGLEVWDGKKWSAHLQQLDSNVVVLDIATGGDDMVWVATNSQGLFAYNGKKWNNFLLQESPISLVTATKDGRIWAVSQSVGGLQVWNPKAGRFTQAIPGPFPIRTIKQAPNGTLLAGGILNGLHIKK
jgi:ligand-binding sensor domain-containing protein